MALEWPENVLSEESLRSLETDEAEGKSLSLEIDDVFEDQVFSTEKAIVSLVTKIDIATLADQDVPRRPTIGRSFSASEPREFIVWDDLTSAEEKQEDSEAPKSEGSLTQAVKDIIRSKIQLSRINTGKEELTADFTPREHEKTYEDMRRRTVVRHRNKMHAVKSRERFRTHLESLKKRNTSLKEEHNQLLRSIFSLEEIDAHFSKLAGDLHDSTKVSGSPKRSPGPARKRIRSSFAPRRCVSEPAIQRNGEPIFTSVFLEIPEITSEAVKTPNADDHVQQATRKLKTVHEDGNAEKLTRKLESLTSGFEVQLGIQTFWAQSSENSKSVLYTAPQTESQTSLSTSKPVEEKRSVPEEKIVISSPVLVDSGAPFSLSPTKIGGSKSHRRAPHGKVGSPMSSESEVHLPNKTEQVKPHGKKSVLLVPNQTSIPSRNKPPKTLSATGLDGTSKQGPAFHKRSSSNISESEKISVQSNGAKVRGPDHQRSNVQARVSILKSSQSRVSSDSLKAVEPDSTGTSSIRVFHGKISDAKSPHVKVLKFFEKPEPGTIESNESAFSVSRNTPSKVDEHLREQGDSEFKHLEKIERALHNNVGGPLVIQGKRTHTLLTTSQSRDLQKKIKDKAWSVHGEVASDSNRDQTPEAYSELGCSTSQVTASPLVSKHTNVPRFNTSVTASLRQYSSATVAAASSNVPAVPSNASSMGTRNLNLGSEDSSKRNPILFTALTKPAKWPRDLPRRHKPAERKCLNLNIDKPPTVNVDKSMTIEDKPHESASFQRCILPNDLAAAHKDSLSPNMDTSLARRDRLVGSPLSTGSVSSCGSTSPWSDYRSESNVLLSPDMGRLSFSSPPHDPSKIGSNSSRESSVSSSSQAFEGEYNFLTFPNTRASASIDFHNLSSSYSPQSRHTTRSDSTTVDDTDSPITAPSMWSWRDCDVKSQYSLSLNTTPLGPISPNTSPLSPLSPNTLPLSPISPPFQLSPEMFETYLDEVADEVLQDADSSFDDVLQPQHTRNGGPERNVNDPSGSEIESHGKLRATFGGFHSQTGVSAVLSNDTLTPEEVQILGSLISNSPIIAENQPRMAPISRAPREPMVHTLGRLGALSTGPGFRGMSNTGRAPRESATSHSNVMKPCSRSAALPSVPSEQPGPSGIKTSRPRNVEFTSSESQAVSSVSIEDASKKGGLNSKSTKGKAVHTRKLAKNLDRPQLNQHGSAPVKSVSGLLPGTFSDQGSDTLADSELKEKMKSTADPLLSYAFSSSPLTDVDIDSDSSDNAPFYFWQETF